MSSSSFNWDAIWNNPESHPEAKTLKQYYRDFAAAVEEIKNDVPEHENDAAFTQAAKVIEALLPITDQMESVEPLTAGKLDKERLALMAQLGKNGLVDVDGPASKMLAEKYIELLKKIRKKEYWADSKSRTDIGGFEFLSGLNQGYLAAFAKHFPEKKVEWKNSIKELENRIAAYDASVESKHVQRKTI